MHMEKHQNIVNKKIDDLIFAEYNPRQLSKEQFKYLKDSIHRFGLVDPIIVNKNQNRKNIIIGGHQRCKVAKAMGIKDVPCLELDLDYDKERELNVRLNKNTGDWDFNILGNNFELEELIDWGFKEDDLIDLQTDEPELNDLLGEDKNKDLEIRITLETIQDFESCIDDIDIIIKKYKNAKYSLSGGEI